MVPEHIQQAQSNWQPQSSHYDARIYRVSLKELYWVAPGQIISGDSFDNRFYETVAIPDSPEEFEPILSPMTMMSLGIFGNAYFGDLSSTSKYQLGAERHALFPAYKGSMQFQSSYVDKANWQTALFKKKASSTREWWLDRNLIGDADPLGQFEWYCWYWLGRRIPAYDQHQIKRWLNFRLRQTAMIEKTRAVGLQQALLHWSCDPWAHL